MKKNKLLSLILALLMSASALFTSCGTTTVEEQPEDTAAETEPAPADPADAYTFVGSNYTVTEEGAIAAKTSPDSFTEIYNGAFVDNEILH